MSDFDVPTVYPNEGDVWVCTDCLFAHTYGWFQHEGQWYVNDSDTPCELEPLKFLDDVDLWDNTDSETGEGIDEFSWSSCDGCRSHLGGSRYRLHWTERKA